MCFMTVSFYLQTVINVPFFQKEKHVCVCVCVCVCVRVCVCVCVWILDLFHNLIFVVKRRLGFMDSFYLCSFRTWQLRTSTFTFYFKSTVEMDLIFTFT